MADGEVVGGTSLPLTEDEAGLPERLRERFPHLAGETALRLPGGEPVARLLRGQLAVATYDADGALVDLTGVQTPGVIDRVHGREARDRRLGLRWDGLRPELALWAPTARSVARARLRGGQRRRGRRGRRR